MEDHSSPTSSGMQVQPAPAVKSQRRGRRRGSTTEGAEGEEDADEDSSSSSDTDTEKSQAQLASFRAQWEEELKKLPAGSGVNSNVNSALNLVTSTAASLANPYPNPTSMADAVSRRTTKEKIKKDQTHHPFASGAVSGQRQIVPESPDDQQQPFSVEVPTSGTVEEQARRWFLQGVGFERHGDLYDAVRCYRKAVQLVPDIEYRISQGLMEESGRSSNNESDDEDDDDESSSASDLADYDRENDDKNENVVLLKLFLKQIEQREWAFFQKVMENEKAHIGDLPVEVISYILRWVVSSDLDVRSLDILSSVCKGFYCIARDEKLWQMACERVWSSCVLDSNYSCYRDMFLTRPRARIDGCYISKITYIRPGEHSFQDQSYRPWHFVEYFRYIRFFPDGTVHFLTSSDEPTMAIPGLRENIARNQNTLTGTYEMYGSNIISAVVTSQSQPKIGFNNNKMKRNETQTQQSTSFHIELQVCSVKGRHNWMLKWVHHAVFIKKTTITNGKNARQQNAPTATITSTSLELSPTKYPPLLFSRVKSFTPKSECILE